MRVSWLPNGWKDYFYWQENDRKILLRINEIIRDASRNPLSGIGKPEPLKNHLKGWWSRRITQEHRLIYQVEGERLLIMQCRFHYDDWLRPLRYTSALQVLWNPFGRMQLWRRGL